MKYRRANTKKEWLDVGGRKNWRKYAFPAFKFSQEEAMEQLDVNHEVVLVCPFQTIVLGKASDGTYRKITNLRIDKMQILDQ